VGSIFSAAGTTQRKNPTLKPLVGWVLPSCGLAENGNRLRTSKKVLKNTKNDGNATAQLLIKSSN